MFIRLVCTRNGILFYARWRYLFLTPPFVSKISAHSKNSAAMKAMDTPPKPLILEALLVVTLVELVDAGVEDVVLLPLPLPLLLLAGVEVRVTIVVAPPEVEVTTV